MVVQSSRGALIGAGIASAILVLFGLSAFLPGADAGGVGIALIWMGLITSPVVTLVLRNSDRPPYRLVRFIVGAAPVVVAFIVLRQGVDGGGTVEAEPTQAVDTDVATYAGFARKMLASRLRDPQSAKLSDLMAFKTGDKLAICGKVNAKNGFGGYGASEPFIVSDSGIFVGEAEATGERVLTECSGAITSIVPETMLGN